MKKRIPLLASFLLPFFIAVIVCIDHGVYPFGERCILQVDMYHQYCPFFTELMDKLKNGGNLQYSWDIGLGADFVSLYAYYLASPLNWILVLWPSGYVIEFMTILTLLKIGLCGLTFAWYLKRHFKTNHFAVSIFGMVYALSAFMAAYSWNIMWTDCLVLAPLVILGLERMIKEGRPLLYYVSLALCILCNYYISIMICFFLVLWFFVTWILEPGAGVRAWLRFGIYSLLAGGTGAVLMIPTAIILGYNGSVGTSFPEKMEWYFNILEELARHAVFTETYTGNDHWPNLYCGVFVLIFFVLFLLNRQISWKKKLLYVPLLVLFVISFANNMLDFIWHGFRYPTSLPGRQSFLYIFLLLVMSFDTFLHLRGNRIWHVIVAAMINGGFWFAVYKFVGEEQFDYDAWLGSVIFAGIYVLILLVCLAGRRLGRPKLRRMMLLAGCLTVIIEISANFDETGLGTTSRTAYLQQKEDYAAVLATAKEQSAEDGELFYRVEELERKTKNDAPLYDYSSATQFSSLMNLNVSHFYQELGVEGGKNFYSSNGMTPLLEAMFSVKYVLADNGLEESPLRKMTASGGENWLYENRYVLPLGFVMSEEVIDAWDYDDLGDISAQNQLARLLGATEQMFISVASESVVGESGFTAEEDGCYYATYDKTDVSDLTEETSDGRTRTFSKVSHGYTLDLGYCRAGTEVTLRNDEDKTVSITVYRLDLEALDTAFETLNRQTMEMTSFSDTKVTGTIAVTEAGRLIFTIAKEAGWTLFVDGREVEPEEFGGAFISVHLEEGEHQIELTYESPGLRMGAAISGACVLVFLLLILIRKKQGKAL